MRMVPIILGLLSLKTFLECCPLCLSRPGNKKIAFFEKVSSKSNSSNKNNQSIQMLLSKNITKIKKDKLLPQKGR
jgi:hypothetical protein